jgi:ketosteroid isomerase-like protein
MIRSLFIAALAACIALPAAASDTADIERVMAAFHQAVVAHDGERLKGFFLPQAAWFNVLAKDGTLRPGGYQDFAAFVSQGKADLDPRHTDVEIRSDGTVATAWFRFSFMIGGEEKNRGYETWQLIRTGAGWRIASLAYSSNPTP